MEYIKSELKNIRGLAGMSQNGMVEACDVNSKATIAIESASGADSNIEG